MAGDAFTLTFPQWVREDVRQKHAAGEKIVKYVIRSKQQPPGSFGLGDDLWVIELNVADLWAELSDEHAYDEGQIVCRRCGACTPETWSDPCPGYLAPPLTR